jgi:hypothetical protein
MMGKPEYLEICGQVFVLTGQSNDFGLLFFETFMSVGKQFEVALPSRPLIRCY